MKQPTNAVLLEKFVSFEKRLLDHETGVITGKTGIIAHLIKLNTQTYKNTKFRTQVTTVAKVFMFIIGSGSILVGIVAVAKLV